MRKSIAELTENIMSIEDFQSAVKSLKGFTQTDWINFKYYIDMAFSQTDAPFLCSPAQELSATFIDKGSKIICDRHNTSINAAIERIQKYRKENR